MVIYLKRLMLKRKKNKLRIRYMSVTQRMNTHPLENSDGDGEGNDYGDTYDEINELEESRW